MTVNSLNLVIVVIVVIAVDIHVSHAIFGIGIVITCKCLAAFERQLLKKAARKIPTKKSRYVANETKQSLTKSRRLRTLPPAVP